MLQPVSERNGIAPFLRWPGGKRWFAGRYAHLIPRFSGRYIEPFLGSGAVYFHLRPRKALLGDCNGELMETYISVKEEWPSVVAHLNQHATRHSKTHYYRTRSKVPKVRAERAARFIYLNRACWNGLYRVNAQGQFNVPIGTREVQPFDPDVFRELSDTLSTADLVCCDFQKLVDRAGRNDLLFVDPPYTVHHSNNGFVKYNESLFSWSDQERLAERLVAAKERGASIVSTNAPHESVRRLYREHFKLVKIGRFSPIASKGNFRGKFKELIILSA